MVLLVNKRIIKHKLREVLAAFSNRVFLFLFTQAHEKFGNFSCAYLSKIFFWTPSPNPPLWCSADFFSGKKPCNIKGFCGNFLCFFSTCRLFIGFKHKIFPNFGCISFFFCLKSCFFFLQFSRQNLQKFLQYFFLFRLFFQTKSSEKSENLTEFFILKVQNRAEKIQQIVALFHENSGQIFTFSFQKNSLHATFFCNQKSWYSAILRRISAYILT